MGGGGSGGGSGGGNTTSTVTKSDPWGPQQPHLEKQYKEAEGFYDTRAQTFYPGQTFSSFAPETEAALNAQSNRAIYGSPLTQAYQNQIGATLAGDYLSSGNPHFSQMADRVTAKVRPGIEARFAGSGRLNSGLASRALGEGLGDAIGQLAYQSYNDERTNQMRAAMFAPQAAQQDYFDIAKLAEVGGSREDLAQQAINEAVSRHNFAQQEPWQRLGQYSSIVQGSSPGGETSAYTTSPGYRRNVGTGMLGGAATGAGLGFMMGGGNPYYAGAGAGLGGLLGMM